MSIRILVVDDNVDIINNVREYLSLKGWTIEWCTTGPDALRRLQADPFDLLILDLGLPGLDGLTICRELRAAHSKLPAATNRKRRRCFESDEKPSTVNWPNTESAARKLNRKTLCGAK